MSLDGQLPALSGLEPDGTLALVTPRVFLPLLRPARFKGARGGRGAAKCLAWGSLVVMANGARCPVQDVRVGNQVMGRDGKPRRVLSTTRGIGQLYRVSQKGGESYVVNADHVLSLKRARGARKRPGQKERYTRYGDVANILVTSYNEMTQRWKNNFFGYRSGAIELSEKELLIPPYVFGAWLGDGSEGRAELTSMDQEVISAFLIWGSSLGCIHDRRPSKSKANGYILVYSRGTGSNKHRNNPAKSVLRQLGVLEDKHVPIQYQTASIAQRLEFLAGFIDTDGTYKNGCYTIAQKRENVIREVKYIADLCGFRTNLRPMWMKINGEPRRYWKLTISGAVERIPCRVERKKPVQTAPNKDWLCGAISVEPAGLGCYAGFEVDGDHLFLLGDCTVTHNSHLIAERLVADCIQEHQRVACLREYQSSIKESVKTLLEDKIRQFGQDRWFTSTEVEIRGPNDSLFVFKGLHDYVSKPGGGPAAGIKSLEGFTRYWGEEAQTFSKRSLDILTPTARGSPGSTNKPEMWFSWNPGRETDPIEVLFNDNEGDPDFVCVTATYMDNPWFEASGLRRDMERDRVRDPGKYAHVWLGKYLTRSEAQVFRNWRIEEFETPDDARLYFGADWGFGDPTTLVRMWIRGHELFIDHEAYATNCPIEAIPSLFLTVPGAKKWRIRADSARPETIDYVKRRGFKITPAIKGKDSVEDGIEFLRSYDIVVHPRCQHTIGELTTYSYKIDPRTDEVLPQLADNNNHIIDSMRYGLEDERNSSSPLILPPAVLQRMASSAPTRNRFGGTMATLVSRNRFARVR